MSDNPQTHDLVQSLMGDVRLIVSEVVLLRGALARRMTVEQATGVVMFRYGVDDATALHLLEQWSTLADSSLSEVAQTVVDCAGGKPPQAGADPSVLRIVSRMLRDADPPGH